MITEVGFKQKSKTMHIAETMKYYATLRDIMVIKMRFLKYEDKATFTE